MPEVVHTSRSMVPQVSSVCKTLAIAAARVMGSSAGLNLHGVGKLVQLDSPLLRRWSPLVRKLQLNGDNAFQAPGLSGFLVANSGGLRALDLTCSSMLAAAHIEHMLCSCSQVTDSHLWGSQAISIFPAALSHLDVTFQFADFTDASHWDRSTVSALICRLAHQQHLEAVALRFSEYHGGDIQLVSPFLLPKLHSFDLDLVLRDDSTGLDLSWLHRQPCRKLTVSIQVDSDSARAHMRVIDQLKHAPVSKLVMRWKLYRVPRSVERHWARLKVREEVQMRCARPDVFTSARQPMRAIPSCPRIVVWQRSSEAPAERQAFFLSASAISREVTQVQLVLSKHLDLHLVGGEAHPRNLEVSYQ